eukprot:CAMPEP_0202881998 /NCGR_PEP_ID=MMETSP1391-20130828/37386_1 /ASSEMBLY_ACC=CAM_ASM_000867 /TAXON_ID=1034604 /ORGANISM="Chlamydomonas leiostraca, Strain SAG 11-49" /LENGTH=124 /DNA_ID=CAMNT_0049564781 /DNA_START=56 /DNA_END=427 /DNA_ORIENTATION=-
MVAGAVMAAAAVAVAAVDAELALLIIPLSPDAAEWVAVEERGALLAPWAGVVERVREERGSHDINPCCCFLAGDAGIADTGCCAGMKGNGNDAMGPPLCAMRALPAPIRLALQLATGSLRLMLA